MVHSWPQLDLVGGFWNGTGLLEAGKMHTMVHLVTQHKLACLVLTETHIKQQDQFVVDGYTFSQGAAEELDENGKP